MLSEQDWQKLYTFNSALSTNWQALPVFLHNHSIFYAICL